jgi:nucleoside-diphosphate-sugar epimerase
MSVRTVAVTGGNGRIGGAILAELADDYRTANLARGKRREEVSDAYLTTDLTDAGEVYGSLARSCADAVVHMGTIPSPLSHPGYVTYESNVATAYHVLEAATELGLEAVVLPSSVNAMGAAFQEAPMAVDYLPVDEAHPLTPRDPYAVAKHAMEVTADGFGRLPDAPRIASLRYPWVREESVLRELADEDRTAAGVDVATDPGRDELYTYLHLADAATAARAAVEADFDGHEVVWTVASDTTLAVPSATVAAEAYPDAEIREPLEGHEALVTTAKAESLLGWTPEHTWRELSP